MNNTTEELLTVKQVADRLRLSKSKVYELIDRGHIVPHRFGGSIRITATDLGAYIDSCRVERQPQRKPARRPRLKHVQI